MRRCSSGSVLLQYRDYSGADLGLHFAFQHVLLMPSHSVLPYNEFHFTKHATPCFLHEYIHFFILPITWITSSIPSTLDIPSSITRKSLPYIYICIYIRGILSVQSRGRCSQAGLLTHWAHALANGKKVVMGDIRYYYSINSRQYRI